MLASHRHISSDLPSFPLHTIYPASPPPCIPSHFTSSQLISSHLAVHPFHSSFYISHHILPHHITSNHFTSLHIISPHHTSPSSVTAAAPLLSALSRKLLQWAVRPSTRVPIQCMRMRTLAVCAPSWWWEETWRWLTATSRGWDRAVSYADSASLRSLLLARSAVGSVCRAFTSAIFRISFWVGLMMTIFILKMWSVRVTCFVINSSRKSTVLNMYIVMFCILVNDSEFFPPLPLWGDCKDEINSSTIFNFARNLKIKSYQSQGWRTTRVIHCISAIINQVMRWDWNQMRLKWRKNRVFGDSHSLKKCTKITAHSVSSK